MTPKDPQSARAVLGRPLSAGMALPVSVMDQIGHGMFYTIAGVVGLHLLAVVRRVGSERGRRSDWEGSRSFGWRFWCRKDPALRRSTSRRSLSLLQRSLLLKRASFTPDQT